MGERKIGRETGVEERETATEREPQERLGERKIKRRHEWE